MIDVSKVIFWKKLVSPFLGPKCAQNKVFKFCDKSMHVTFMIFYMTLQQHNGLKLTQTFFLRVGGGEGLVLGFWGFGLNIGLKFKCIMHLPYKERVNLGLFCFHCILFSYMCKPSN